MIKLDLKSINLYDIDFEKFTPEIPDNFHRWIDLDIGIEGEQGSSIFHFAFVLLNGFPIIVIKKVFFGLMH